ncbi:hypothetical protein TBLA_0A01180 [Henningerozyma blattae CBS 6284]|uniref:Uncharacterized protein n=1 Tax=Henningerozyma blattae (strain ATCC 34711 / CBS 6284 / DSM 70876 / NBRC 10599 / NRRL Y-10934 / UCD 77-7) TaxID=1071380 RepID=I2GUW6_HENB6|nr:hypothetical protein TBLA_0A01180 [Tetrapisispora blattae CBS 6284]CCH57918.1 hypothetical protein TBLA_0A01180 [Tetrapisispora blattae CBS 6284]
MSLSKSSYMMYFQENYNNMNKTNSFHNFKKLDHDTERFFTKNNHTNNKLIPKVNVSKDPNTLSNVNTYPKRFSCGKLTGETCVNLYNEITPELPLNFKKKNKNTTLKNIRKEYSQNTLKEKIATKLASFKDLTKDSFSTGTIMNDVLEYLNQLEIELEKSCRRNAYHKENIGLIDQVEITNKNYHFKDMSTSINYPHYESLIPENEYDTVIFTPMEESENGETKQFCQQIQKDNYLEELFQSNDNITNTISVVDSSILNDIEANEILHEPLVIRQPIDLNNTKKKIEKLIDEIEIFQKRNIILPYGRYKEVDSSSNYGFLRKKLFFHSTSYLRRKSIISDDPFYKNEYKNKIFKKYILSDKYLKESQEFPNSFFSLYQILKELFKVAHEETFRENTDAPNHYRKSNIEKIDIQDRKTIKEIINTLWSDYFE